ncbi:MAG: methyltransferase domain-containing protein [Acidobacteriia bacterium]|nr:methyltransferase domain-containing protein [Terriglobia bacterium]
MTATDRTHLRDKVRVAYSAAAELPNEKHAFPVGRGFAQSLGYPADLLDRLPAVASDAFAGVSNVSVFAEIPSGATILDLGCGASLDALIAARRVGPAGKVIAVDFSTAMLARAHQAVMEAGASNLELREAGAEQLPIVDEEIDVAMVNGIFNLNPSRDAIFRELARVLRRGGTAFTAELILSSPLPPEARASESNWFA